MVFKNLEFFDRIQTKFAFFLNDHALKNFFRPIQARNKTLILLFSLKVNCDLINHISKLSLANESSRMKNFTERNRTVFHKEIGKIYFVLKLLI